MTEQLQIQNPNCLIKRDINADLIWFKEKYVILGGINAYQVMVESNFMYLQVTLTPYPSPLKHSKTPAQTPPPSPGFAGRDRHHRCMPLLKHSKTPAQSPGFAGRDCYHRRVVSSPVRPFIHLSLSPSKAFPGSPRPRGPQATTAVACSSAPPLRLRWPLPSSSLVFASSAPRMYGSDSRTPNVDVVLFWCFAALQFWCFVALERLMCLVVLVFSSQLMFLCCVEWLNAIGTRQNCVVLNGCQCNENLGSTANSGNFDFCSISSDEMIVRVSCPLDSHPVSRVIQTFQEAQINFNDHREQQKQNQRINAKVKENLLHRRNHHQPKHKMQKDRNKMN
ncbi:hypothetical protein HN51_049800 [Arachis hypogaea]